MFYQLQPIKKNILTNFYKKSMKELDDFFKLDWTHHQPDIYLVPDRKTINLLMHENTKSWLVGWANNKKIFLLSPDNYEKESNHKYSDLEYRALIKHELAHCFSDIVSGDASKPKWLLEGTSLYLAGQNKLKKKPSKFQHFIDCYDNNGEGKVYNEAGFAVEFLVTTYGKEKLIKLLKTVKKTSNKNAFNKLFKSIYKFDLKYNNFQIL